MIEIISPNPMLWRELSAAAARNCIGYWYTIPDWHQALIIGQYEVEQALLAAQKEDD